MDFNRETRWPSAGDLARYDSCQKPWEGSVGMIKGSGGRGPASLASF